MGKAKFIVTGLSRSGSKFLASFLNRSKQVNVYHDHKIDKFKGAGLLNYDGRKKLNEKKKNNLIKELNNTIKNDNGYISGAYRLDLDQLDADKKGILIRHPEKILVSYLNMHKQFKSVNRILINWIDEELKNLDKHIENGCIPIKFEKMINDKDYLNEKTKELGINDIEANDKILSKKVNSLSKRYSIKDVPEETLDFFRRRINWFVKKYELNKV